MLSQSGCGKNKLNPEVVQLARTREKQGSRDGGSIPPPGLMIVCRIDKCQYRGANYCFAPRVVIISKTGEKRGACFTSEVYFPKEEILDHVWCYQKDCKHFMQLKDTDVWDGNVCMADDIEISEEGCLTYEKD